MSTVTAALQFHSPSSSKRIIHSLIQCMPIEKVVVLFDENQVDILWPKCEGMRASSLASGKALQKIIEETDTDFLLIITHSHTIHISPGTL